MNRYVCLEPAVSDPPGGNDVGIGEQNPDQHGSVAGHGAADGGVSSVAGSQEQSVGIARVAGSDVKEE